MQNALATHQNKQTIITHRGLCSLYPENSLPAIIAGLGCSDLVEFDVQLTKDHQLIVFHDRGLKRVTDVAQHSQFIDRNYQSDIDQYRELKNDWWVKDFTLSELKKLNLKQDIPYRPNLGGTGLKICTLQQVLVKSLNFKKMGHTLASQFLNSGLLIEVKQEIHGKITKNDQMLCQLLSELLRKYNLDSKQKCQQNRLPVFLQAFNLEILTKISTSNEIYQLFDYDVIVTQQLLRDHSSPNILGIGVTEQNLISSLTHTGKNLRNICNSMGYQLNYWTIRDDRPGKKPFDVQTYEQVYLKLKEMGINGYITQFPLKCRQYLNAESYYIQRTISNDASPFFPNNFKNKQNFEKMNQKITTMSTTSTCSQQSTDSFLEQIIESPPIASLTSS